MPADRAALEELVAQIGGFYIRDKKLSRAQAAMARAIAAGGTIDGKQAGRYLALVRRYFSGFDREARAQFADVERRLARVSQVQFNLTAERGVAARRVELTQGVLARIENLARK